MTRVPGTADRRVIHVAITPRAQIALEDRALIQDSVLAHRIAALSEEEQRHLTDLLTKIIDTDPVEDTAASASHTHSYQKIDHIRG